MHYEDRDIVLAPGKRIYGATIGLAIMDRKFARPVGDLGNAATFDFPVIYDVVHEVRGMPSMSVEETNQTYDRLLQSCLRLVDQGAHAVATTCGYAALFQDRIAQELPVPFAASSLLQIPSIFGMLPKTARLGVIAARGTNLKRNHLAATGCTSEHFGRLTTVGLENSATWERVFLKAEPGADLDVGALRREIVGLCKDALHADPALRGFICEAANIGVYSPAIQAATGLPVWDAVSLINWLHLTVRQTYAGKL